MSTLLGVGTFSLKRCYSEVFLFVFSCMPLLSPHVYIAIEKGTMNIAVKYSIKVNEKLQYNKDEISSQQK